MSTARNSRGESKRAEPVCQPRIATAAMAVATMYARSTAGSAAKVLGAAAWADSAAKIRAEAGIVLVFPSSQLSAREARVRRAAVLLRVPARPCRQEVEERPELLVPDAPTVIAGHLGVAVRHALCGQNAHELSAGRQQRIVETARDVEIGRGPWGKPRGECQRIAGAAVLRPGRPEDERRRTGALGAGAGERRTERRRGAEQVGVTEGNQGRAKPAHPDAANGAALPRRQCPVVAVHILDQVD